MQSSPCTGVITLCILQLVFERGNGATPPLWYFPGKLGLASSDVSEGQCILRFDEDADGTSVDACSSDRANCMWVAFNRCSDTGVKVRDAQVAGLSALREWEPLQAWTVVLVVRVHAPIVPSVVLKAIAVSSAERDIRCACQAAAG